MTNKQKVITLGIVGLVILGVVISILTYQGLTPNDEQVSEIKNQAQEYIKEKFSSDYQVTDSFYDNVDVYDMFTYAAVVESEQDDRFRFLVFEHHETNELTNSYVAESFEYELETVLRPKLNKAFGEDHLQELWLTYPKDAGMQLGINHHQVPSVKEVDLKPIIRVTLDRGKNEDDEKKLNQIIEEIKNELNISGGHVTLSFNDNAIIFKDKDIRKEF